jgi:hypothetical protein
MGRTTVFSLEDDGDDAALELDTPSDLDDQLADAHAELDEHSDGIDELLDQSDEAQDAVDTMSNIQDTLENSPNTPISTEAKQVTQICISSLYKRLGMNNDSLISLESASQSIALETVGEGIKKIIETLKKAIAYIWSKLVAFYNFIRTKILGLFKKKHAEVKTKVDNTSSQGYTKAQAETKSEQLTDLGIFTAFADGGRYVHEGMVVTQMVNMEKAVSKLSYLNESCKLFIEMMKKFEKYYSKSEMAKVSDVLATNPGEIIDSVNEFFTKHFSANEEGDPLFMTGLPYYENLYDDTRSKPVYGQEVLPKFRHQRGNGVSSTQAFISTGSKATLEKLLGLCKGIEDEVERASKNTKQVYLVDIDEEDQYSTEPYVRMAKEINRNYKRIITFLAYMNKEIITLATKSVRETYRYMELSTKAAEEAEKH